MALTSIASAFLSVVFFFFWNTSSLNPAHFHWTRRSLQQTQCWSFRNMLDDIIDGGMQISGWIEPCQRPARCLENMKRALEKNTSLQTKAGAQLLLPNQHLYQLSDPNICICIWILTQNWKGFFLSFQKNIWQNPMYECQRSEHGV